jgi:hypothetical protein
MNASAGEPVFQEVKCPVTKHVLGEYYLPHASGLLRYVCRGCKRTVVVTLHEGQVTVNVAKD